MTFDNTMVMLMQGKPIEEILLESLRDCIRTYIVDYHFDWANHPERVSVTINIVCKDEKWYADVTAHYRSMTEKPDKKLRILVQEALPYDVVAEELIARIGSALLG